MANSSLCVLYICTLVVSTCLLKITGLFSHNNFRPGYHLQGGEIIVSYVSTSWEQCVEYCLARSICLSIEMEIRFNLCRILSSSTMSDGVLLKRSPGIWYSEKTDWNKETLDTQCLDVCSSSETCFINGSPNCVITECANPPILDNTSVILGTELFVGSKVLYKCLDDVNVTATSVCGTNGQWSLQEFTCPIDFECEDDWVSFHESCYLFPVKQENYNNAQQYCKDLSARLVHVETNEENMFLRDYLHTRPFRDYWIGMTYSPNDNKWKWSDGISDVLFFDWSPGEPNKASEKCVVFGDTLSYQWADVKCSSSRNILCELAK